MPRADNGEWLACAVPGDVNATLVARGKMPDPHFGVNARKCGWVIGKDWWYRRSFDLDGPCAPAALVFTEVYGPADVWLNGSHLGEMRNAHREFRFDVSDKLRPRGNDLVLRFKSIERLIGRPTDECFGWDDAQRGTLRMPNYMFGWDWALPLPPIGLGGQVALELDRPHRLVDVAIQPFTSGRVDFSFEVTPEAKAAGYRIDVEVRGHGVRLRQGLARGLRPGVRDAAGGSHSSWRVTTASDPAHRSYMTFSIPKPRLWWPAGYGEPALYDYSVSLVVNGKTADRRAGKLGLREVRLVERPFTPDAGPGMAMAVEVNGVEVFCKGANWIPTELWPAATRPDDYDFYLRKTVEANFNMQRVWGGGIYERDRFYEKCDELGVMVWQDFMFASQGYPLTVLRDEVMAEAQYQLRRLRNYPCVVLWCGCNEDVYSWDFHSEVDPRHGQQVFVGEGKWRFERTRQDPELYAILRGLTGKLGLGVPFVQSSPESRDDFGNMPNSGNSHVSCWKHALFNSDGHPERFRGHFERVCSFDSEFCIQGPCSVASFRRFMPADRLWPPNEDWTFHVQRGHRRIPHHEQTLMIAGAIFGPIDSLQKYVKHGQATHAEMMRAEFESARRDRPNNGGTMFWMYNDCWPTANWSVIDYYRTPKPAYYAARRACAPRLPIIFERGGEIAFFFGNDTPRDCKVNVTYGQERLDGRRVWTRRRRLSVPANGTLKFDAVERRRLDAPAGDYLFVDAAVDGAPLDRVTCFPDGWKDIAWPAPTVSMQVGRRDRRGGRHRLHLRLATDAYARFCHLRLKEFDPAVAFSDNFFDLCAGGEKTVVVESPRPLAAEDLRIGHWGTEWD
jgi:beta-mannosidase